MSIQLHHGDLPAGLDLGPVVAVDTETMGLNPVRDRLVPGAASSRRRHLPSGADRQPAAGPARSRAQPARRCWKIPRSSSCSISRASIWPRSRHISASIARRSIAPRSRPSWCAPSPTGTGSRICARNCSASSSRSSSKPPTGAPRHADQEQLQIRRLRRALSAPLKEKLDPMLAARRAHAPWPRPASASCRPAPRWIGWAGTSRHFRALTRPSADRPGARISSVAAQRLGRIPGSAWAGWSVLDLPGVRRYGPASLDGLPP